ncbi:hypothetical protein CCAN11_1670003 [Capnocytophaga canimorsus]|uniref:Uncharacterized protein n=1 Tax=Capnocytophaga canimorsus TaxID=28188 RepID=A0A0B7I8K5_9FLAO|nr:hypothetical protein CCAN11_1670003 [Capnocytophaga canimorsus]
MINKFKNFLTNTVIFNRYFMHKYQIFNILVIYFTNVSRGTLGSDVKSMISLKRGYSCQAERSRSR